VSFRTRLVITSLVTLAVGLGALLVAGNVLLAQRVRSEATSLLRARAEAQIAALTVTPTKVVVRETPNDAMLDRRSWVIVDGRVVERPAGVSRELDRMAVAIGLQERTIERDGTDDLRLLAEPIRAPGTDTPRGAVVVALSVAPLENLQQLVLFGSVIIAVFVLVAGGLATTSAVNGALRPVAHMTSSARDWGAHDLDRRFHLGAPRDELTGLAATLDGLLGRIAASRRHEQRFASEIAHELRTPVAGIRGRAELALAAAGPDAGAETADERTAALTAIVAQAERLDRTLDTLLAVARREFDPTVGVVDLRALVGELEGVAIVAPDVPLQAEGDPEVVMRALAPLLENARRHAREVVTLELSEHGDRVRITVRDDGPGVDPELRQRIFDPGVRGSDADPAGAGLGLPLARRMARSCGGDVRVGDGPGGAFVLELPAVQD
jgi:signal transduction histidine kinase